MKKTSKKVRSERVNALRKRYDDVLEEDKKRKDRNSYILEKLDKMRLSSTVAQLTDKNNFISTRYPDIGMSLGRKIGNYDEYSSQLKRHVSTNVEAFEETLILQEISKKFILIPKRQSTPFSNYALNNKSITNDGFDWKQKYEILNQLKKSELESHIEEYSKDKYNSEANERKDEIEQMYNDAINGSDTYNIQKENKDIFSKEKLKIKTSCEDDNKVLYNLKKNEAYVEEKENKQIKEGLIRPKTESLETKKCQSIDDTQIYNDNAGVEHDNSKNSTPNNNIVKICMDNTKTNFRNVKSNEPLVIESKDVQNITYFEGDDKNAIQEVNPNDLVYEINNDIPVANATADNDIRSLNEITNIQECNSKDNIMLQDNDNRISEGHETAETIDLTYLNDPGYLTNKGIEDSTHYNEPQEEILDNNDVVNITSDIEAFDTEQREMFCSEQVEENDAYDDSNIAGDAYNQEFIDNEEYQENPEYFDGTQIQHAYPPEINEHEETSQRYDQNYENQYFTYDQEYKETQQFEETGQCEQSEMGDKIQTDVDQLQYQENNDDKQEHLEKQLDYEQGLIEKQITNEPQVATFEIQEKEVEQIAD